MLKGIFCGFGLMLLLSSCNDLPKKEPLLVNAIASPAGNNSSLPYLFSNGENTLLSWVEEDGDSLVTLHYATLKNGLWQHPQLISQGNDWFVNWADFPIITENNGNLLSHQLKKSSADTYSYDVILNVRPADAEKWTTNLPLHTDGTLTEHGFVSAEPYAENDFFICWLDGRNSLEKEDGSQAAMNIRAALVTAKGEIKEEALLDSSTCDCCQTTAAITSKGPVVLYRDRTEEEVRDISIVRMVDGQWTSPKTIYADNWQIKGCPVNGPKAASLANNLAVAWFTAADDKPKVKLLFSQDGGEHFGNLHIIDDISAIGRVDVELLDKTTAVVSWMATKGEGAEIKAVKVSTKGERSKVLSIATLDGSRSTGFPQMALINDKIYFAWTAVSKETSRVKTAYVITDQF